LLDAKQLFEEQHGEDGCAAFNHHIEKRGLIEHIARLSFIDRRTPHDSDAALGLDQGDGAIKIGLAVSEIGA
jgi:hypothetical protein